jgi:hypothetical protein
LFEYDFLSEGAIEEYDFLIISFEKLMFLKVLALNHKHLESMRDRMAEINSMIHDFY